MQLKERAAPALVDVTHAAKAARGPCHTHGARMCWCKLPTSGVRGWACSWLNGGTQLCLYY